ncbi:TPA: hypothetical protein ACM7GQ_004763 [Escherichia coli]|nr:hypothetical protein [Escherichia coli]MCV7954961.1 hypothetical protein [Escherichia coli]MDA5364292.1 hypothetical protein [Escherichia coli]MDF8578861.1 hypothetical protein [Escherichia coli]MDF8658332.1 hypothetical protein [Escherichia coli]MDF8865262.1 hypothetical protein [Escherichia coli]
MSDNSQIRGSTTGLLCRLMVGKREDAGLDTPVSTGAEMIRM